MSISVAQYISEFSSSVPKGVDMDAILNAWQALDNIYDIENWQIPMPLWAQRPYDDLGDEAWINLQPDLTNSDPSQAICIYIHIPFCSRKCGFCDSYSFKLGSHRDEHIEKYISQVCHELKLWSDRGNLRQRPVSTIHMGGGTPTFVGSIALERIIKCCIENFAITPSTELALEATVEDLSPPLVLDLHCLGFRRLHIGVQSMDDSVRKKIGRYNSARDVLSVVDATLEQDWVVSVDLLCGLPGQTLSGYIAGIDALVKAGVNGFSLYELLIRSQNKHWAERHDLIKRSHLPNYFMLHTGANVLEMYGYQKNLFNHWSDQHDTNKYFTFPIRNEDLLAVGAIADGVFGAYHYRHPPYADYLRRSNTGTPVLAGGLRQNKVESVLRPIEISILSGHIRYEIINEIKERVNDGSALIERWLANRMIKSQADDLILMTNGTWFAGNLITEVRKGITASCS